MSTEKSPKDRIDELESALKKLHKLLDTKLGEHGIVLHPPKPPKGE